VYGNGHFALDKRTGGLSQEAPVVALLDLRALGAEPPTARASWPIVDLVLLIAAAPDVCPEATRLASDDAWAFPGVSKYLPPSSASSSSSAFAPPSYFLPAPGAGPFNLGAIIA